MILAPASLKASFLLWTAFRFQHKNPISVRYFPSRGYLYWTYVIVIFYSTPRLAQWRLVGIIGFYQI